MTSKLAKNFCSGLVWAMLILFTVSDDMITAIRGRQLGYLNSPTAKILAQFCYILFFGSIYIYNTLKKRINEEQEFFLRIFAKGGGLSAPFWLLIYGVLDIIGSLMAAYSSPFIKSSHFSFVRKTNLFWIFFFSCLVLRSRYIFTEMVGIFFVVLASVIFLVLIKNDKDDKVTQFAFLIIQVISRSFAGLSYVYVEFICKKFEKIYKRRINAFTLSFWLNLYSSIFIVPVTILQKLVLDPRVKKTAWPAGDLPKAAWKCLLNNRDEWTIAHACNKSIDALNINDFEMHCNVAWQTVLIYLSLTVVINAFTVYLMSKGGAALVFVAFQVTLPLSFVFSCVNWTPGHPLWFPQESFDPKSIIVLLLMITGGVIYKFGNEKKKSLKKENDGSEKGLCCYPIFRKRERKVLDVPKEDLGAELA